MCDTWLLGKFGHKSLVSNLVSGVLIPMSSWHHAYPSYAKLRFRERSSNELKKDQKSLKKQWSRYSKVKPPFDILWAWHSEVNLIRPLYTTRELSVKLAALHNITHSSTSSIYSALKKPENTESTEKISSTDRRSWKSKSQSYCENGRVGIVRSSTWPVPAGNIVKILSCLP